MKTLSGNMTTMINSEVLTLATLWQITRTDGVIFRFTDHDRDLVFSGDTYQASSAFSRSSIVNKSDLSVDNLKLQGIIASLDITATDLREGIYDFAEVRIALVNWENPDLFQDIKIRRGWMGEIVLKGNTYEVELRGLTQALARRRGEVYSPDCRVDLFSPRCGLVAADFLETAQVETLVTDRRVFTVPVTARKNVSPVPNVSGSVMNRVIYRSGLDELTMQLDHNDLTPLRAQVITTPAELDDVRDDLSGYYVLGADIDMGAFGDFVPIGSGSVVSGNRLPFTGVFDGRNHRIRDLTIRDNTVNCGLFGVLSGTCKNLGLINVDSDSESSGVRYSAALAGVLRADEGSNNYPDEGHGLIQDCYVIGGAVDTGSGGNGNAGGLVGEVDELSLVIRSFAAIEITGTILTNSGALIGLAPGLAVMTDLYYNSAAAGTTDAGNGVTATDLGDSPEADYTTQASYVGLDFNDIWIMNAGTFVDGGGDLTFAITVETITRTTGSWLNDRIFAHGEITISGTASNNGTFRVRTVTDLVITLDLAEDLSAEVIAGSSVTITSAGAPRHLEGRLDG